MRDRVTSNLLQSAGFSIPVPESWNVRRILGLESGPLPALVASSSATASESVGIWPESDAEALFSESSREGGGPEDEAEAEPEAPEPEAVEPKSDPSGSWACASEVGHFCALVVGALGCLPLL